MEKLSEHINLFICLFKTRLFRVGYKKVGKRFLFSLI